MTRFATPDEIQHWRDHIIANPDGGNVLQGPEFVELKRDSGWAPRYILVGTRAVTVIEKTIPLMGKVWYCPKGPSALSVNDLRKVLKELTPFAKRHGVFSIKIEPELSIDADVSTLGLIKTLPIQHNHSTVYIDLAPSLENIMTDLPQKGRHAIRRAERDGVTVKHVPITEENCRIMYDLFSGTAEANGFPIRPRDYYRKFYEAYGANGRLFFAYFKGEVVAGAYAMVYGKKSMYKDGASIRERKAYGASHLLQWHVIQWAKKRGSLEHDLAGVPPISQINNPDHHFYGLGRFKTSFNKTVTQYVGAYEVPVRPLRAKLWHRFVEKLIRRLYYRRYRQSYY